MARQSRTIGSRLKELRQSLGLTQQEFAKRFGLPARTAQSYERDEALPSAAFLQQLAAQNVDINELLAGYPLRRPAKQDAATYTTIVTVEGGGTHQPGELDLEVLEWVLRNAIEEARTAKHIDWQRTAHRFAAMYARRFGELHSRG